MSVQTLYTAATGMQALETKLDVIANNLANVNTTGFKKGRANFEDLLYRNEALPNEGSQTATGISVGLGTRVSSVQTDFGQGALQTTGDPTDIAIEGQGFLIVQDLSSGEDLYTRSGNLSVNSANQLVLGSSRTGRPVTPAISVPQGSTSITIESDGRVMVTQPGSTSSTEVGVIQLATFVNPEGLLKLGENLFQETDASGTPSQGIPGQNGIGSLQSNALEASNVEPVDELIDLITTQRSFELNSQAVQAGDEILQLISNLRRF